MNTPNYSAFGDLIPDTAASDIASSSTAALFAFSGPVILLCGILLAFIIIEIIIGIVDRRRSASQNGL